MKVKALWSAAIAVLALLNVSPARATYTHGGSFICTGSWSNWPGDGSGSCSFSGIPDAGVGMDSGGDLVVGLASFGTWSFSFSDPCTQAGGLPPIGSASGGLSGSVSMWHVPGLPFSHDMTATVQMIRAGTVVIVQVTDVHIAPAWDDGHTVDPILPAVGIGTWTPIGLATCEQPGTISAVVAGEYQQAA